MKNTTAQRNIALIRVDRIGDLCCTLPVDEVLPELNVTWVIAKGLGFIPKLAEPQRKFIDTPIKGSWKNFKRLCELLKKEKFETVVLFHAPWWISLAAFCARIPQRVASQSQWHSLLFCNKTLKQKRSKSTQHEFDYNLDLLLFGLNKEKDKSHSRLYLRLKSDLNQETLFKFQLTPQNYYVVHAGMSGSALNWPIEKYEELIYQLTMKHKVLMTGTKADEKYLAPLSHLKNNVQVVWAQDLLNTNELIYILSHAIAAVGPSTGVMHLAAATGIPCISLFSPIRVQSATRWAPRSDKSITITPKGNFKSDEDLQNSMNKISVSDILEKLPPHA